MAFYLYMEQDGEGCDYTIGCGERLVTLKARTMEGALQEARRVFEEYGLGTNDEVKLKCALILELSQDIFGDYKEYIADIKAVGEKVSRAAKRQQLEQLKKELGED